MLLKVENLNLSFGGLKVTNNISMHADENRITALIGPNGAGKTTLFNQITGVYKPDSGRIWFDGKRIDGFKPHQICDIGIARTYQVINLFKRMSVIDNVLVGMHTELNSSFFSSLIDTKAKKEEEQEALNRTYELMQFVGLQDNANDLAGTLPYGKQRLLEIIRALASNPKLLLLDEPAAGMNTSEKEGLNRLIREIIKRNVAILIVEHDMKLIMDIADEIFVIESGRNLANGSPKHIQSNPEVVRAYLGGDE